MEGTAAASGGESHGSAVADETDGQEGSEADGAAATNGGESDEWAAVAGTDGQEGSRGGRRGSGRRRRESGN